jgi:hypothetical protein
MAEQKLDLVQFAACQVAQTGTDAPKIVRGQLVDAGASRRRADDVPERLGEMPSPHTRPALLMARKTRPWVMSAAAVHASMALFTHVGIGTVRTCPPLARLTGSYLINPSNRTISVSISATAAKIN